MLTFQRTAWSSKAQEYQKGRLEKTKKPILTCYWKGGRRWEINGRLEKNLSCSAEFVAMPIVVKKLEDFLSCFPLPRMFSLSTCFSWKKGRSAKSSLLQKLYLWCLNTLKIMTIFGGGQRVQRAWMQKCADCAISTTKVSQGKTYVIVEVSYFSLGLLLFTLEEIAHKCPSLLRLQCRLHHRIKTDLSFKHIDHDRKTWRKWQEHTGMYR